MRITYDKSVDAAYIYLQEIKAGEVAMTYTCDPRIVGEINLDFDSANRLIGIEVLNASRKLPPSFLAQAEVIG